MVSMARGHSLRPVGAMESIRTATRRRSVIARSIMARKSISSMAAIFHPSFDTLSRASVPSDLSRRLRSGSNPSSTV